MDALGSMLLLQYGLHSLIGMALRKNARPEVQNSYVEIDFDTDMTRADKMAREVLGVAKPDMKAEAK